jgi:uncharacterized protein HemX
VNNENEKFTPTWKLSLLGAALALLMAGIGAVRMQAQAETKKMNAEGQQMTTQSKFYCNRQALNPAERAHHKQLADKLLATRTNIVETEKGYEFQFSPSTISLAELADWVAAEGKCCQFFDFHIDLESQGTLLCLRLTGEEGIKTFIRAEFQVPVK